MEKCNIQGILYDELHLYFRKVDKDYISCSKFGVWGKFIPMYGLL